MGIHPRLPGLTTDRDPGPAVTAALADDGSSRRAFLTKVALGGAALTVGSQLVPATRLIPLSGAQEESEVTLDADETQARFLASIALAANQAYRAALARSGRPLPEPVAEVVRAFGAHHDRQAATLVTLLPDTVTLDTIPANAAFLAEQTAAVEGAGSTDEVLGALRSLEEAVAATQFAAVGTLESQDDARLVATLVPVCAQQATVLGTLAGQGLAEVLPEAQDDAAALDPAAYPVGEVETESDAPGDTAPTTGPGGDGAEGDGEGGTGQTGDGTESSGGGATDDSGDPATTEG